jgi:hypothetical protein
MEVGGGLDRHEVGEALIEPQVVPPGCGDQVAEPLMGHLMGHHVEHGLAILDGGEPGIHHQEILAVEDGAPVLHGPAHLAGRGDQVELG